MKFTDKYVLVPLERYERSQNLQSSQHTKQSSGSDVRPEDTVFSKNSVDVVKKNSASFIKEGEKRVETKGKNFFLKDKKKAVSFPPPGRLFKGKGSNKSDFRWFSAFNRVKK